jgi:hypothetical protein
MGERHRSRSGRDSAKRQAFYALIEAYYPNVPKIELNARSGATDGPRGGSEVPDA